VRFTALLACLLVAAPAASARQQLATLSPAEAISRAASVAPKPVRALFQFMVLNAAKGRDGFYLDSEKDFHSAANLGVAIRASALPGLTKKYGDDLKAAFVGKTIKLIGQARRMPIGKNGGATATQVEVTHAGQILSVS
jgi:hypothetical protein